MKITPVVILAALIIISSVGAGTWWVYQKQVSPQIKSSPFPSPLEKFPSQEPSPETKTPITQPESGSNTYAIQNPQITITLPIVKQEISSPVRVEGRVNFFGETANIYVKDSKGKILGEGRASLCIETTSCTFEASVVFSKNQSIEGYIQVSSKPMGDQNSTVVETVPVTFRKSQ